MNVIIEATGKTPRVFEKEGILYVWGVFVPENPTEIFARLNKIVSDMYAEKDSLELHFSLGYFNTSSARFLHNFFNKHSDKSNLKVVWHYDADDEDLYESGKEYKEMLDLGFELCEGTFDAKGE